MEGNSYSIGMIGGGAGTSPVVLPLAKQNIRWTDNSPQYFGGTILTTRDDQSVFQTLGQRIADAVGFTRGYIGVDLIHDNNGPVTVTEINPRFSSSYIGYRMATPSNLALRLLGQPPERDVDWSDSDITFHV